MLNIEDLSFLIMGLYTRVSGNKIRETVRESRSGGMVVFMKDTG